MDGFPRLDLFTPREKRAVAVFAIAALVIVVGALAYVRPVERPKARPAAAATLRPRLTPTQFLISAASADVAYATALPFPGSGTPYRTTDGGKTWQRLPVPGGVTSAAAIALSGSGIGLVRIDGLGNTAWVSHDAGKHWAAVVPPSTPNRNGAIGFVSGTTRASYWSQGPAGFFFFESADDGATWRPILQMPSGQALTPGIPAGTNLSVSATTDAYWAVSYSPRQPGVLPSPQQLARSTDGGQTWQEVPLPAAPEGLNIRLNFSAPQGGSGGSVWMWAFSLNPDGSRDVSAMPGFVSTSSDGGVTWSRVRGIDHYPLLTIPGSNDWWAVEGRTIYRSHDLGLTWTSIEATMPASERLMMVTRVTPEVAWNVFGNFQGGLVSEEPDRTHLLRTIDGGRHWLEVKLPGS